MMTPKEMRAATGMSQQQFANYFNISVRTLQEWEQGRKNPDESRLELMEYKLRNEGLLKRAERPQSEEMTVAFRDTPAFLWGLQMHLWRAELEYRAEHLPHGSYVEWLAPRCNSIEEIRKILRDLGLRVDNIVDYEDAAGDLHQWVETTGGITVHVNRPGSAIVGFVTGREKSKRKK